MDVVFSTINKDTSHPNKCRCPALIAKTLPIINTLVSGFINRDTFLPVNCPHSLNINDSSLPTGSSLMNGSGHLLQKSDILKLHYLVTGITKVLIHTFGKY